MEPKTKPKQKADGTYGLPKETFSEGRPCDENGKEYQWDKVNGRWFILL